MWFETFVFHVPLYLWARALNLIHEAFLILVCLLEALYGL